MSSKGLANGWGVYSNDATAGTQANPWAIRDLADLQAMNTKTTTGAYFRLLADIDDCSTFTTIGTSSTLFKGHFDGNGYTLKGFTTQFILGDRSSTNISEVYNTRFTDVNISIVMSGNIFSLVEARHVHECEFIDISLEGTQNAFALQIARGTNKENIYIAHASIRGTSIIECSLTSLLDDQYTDCFYCTDVSVYAKSDKSTGTPTWRLANFVDSTWMGISVITNSIIASGECVSEGACPNYIRGYICADVASSVTCTNSYMLDTITYDKSGGNASAGTPLSAETIALESTYHGGSYLNWDFENIWYWDSASKMPRLRLEHIVETGVFIKIDGLWKPANTIFTKIDGNWVQ